MFLFFSIFSFKEGELCVYKERKKKTKMGKKYLRIGNSPSLILLFESV